MKGNSTGKPHGANRGKNNRNNKKQPDAQRQNRNAAPPAALWQKSGGKAQKPAVARPKWTPPAVSDTPIPMPTCPLCQKPIKDIAAALTDKNSGEAAHFDCVRGHITETETLDAGEVISYIGGGRFGVVYFESKLPRSFKIKKVIEWEAPQTARAGWRDTVADHFSMT